ncbi:IS66 family insertion sequence element accessory protein TnpA [Paenibacillus durus]|uniref:Transposase n=1 Tax=Paenibacillus durus TaxID=44251 RepID=A0A089HSF9_PAEDU|nr:hypothetical protein [Paenibacillus durus]AIQ14921.1 hypothetical protein PDUR_25840 [Paenibacillus durus]
MDREERRELWQARMSDYRQSGLSLKAWCALQEYTPDQLKYWLYKRTPKTPSTTSILPSPQFVSLATLPASPSGTSLHVHVGSARIEITPGFDPVLLRDLVRALESPC